MTEVLFYHLMQRAAEEILPHLLEKTLDRDQKAVIHLSSQDRMRTLDSELWSFSEESFLPHAIMDAPDAEQEPIVLTTQSNNPNNADVCFVIDGAELSAKMLQSHNFARCILMFDGNNTDAVQQARDIWNELKAANYTVTYWQEDENGRFTQKA